MPKPRSVKLTPLRARRPTPSSATHLRWDESTPPCSTRSSTKRPTGLSTRAVTTVVRIPKQRRRPRATLYSPPPSHARKLRAVCMRPSPGSRLSITSPRLTRSHRQSVADRISSAAMDGPGDPIAPTPALSILEDEHRIPVAVEPIPFAHRLRVGRKHRLAPPEGTHEREERGTRQVEVGEESVDGPEAMAGDDDQACLTAEGARGVPLPDRGLQ